MQFIERVSTDLETHFGLFRIEVFQDGAGKEHLALSMGDISPSQGAVLVRMHSECITGDMFFSLHCDCGDQLASALAAISREGRGLLLYLRQEGRGIGLVAKLKAYELQQSEGLDTFAANERLGLQADARDYSLGADILQALGVSSVRLMTNNPDKVAGLQQAGIEIKEQIPLVADNPGPRIKKYLASKRTTQRHAIPE